MGKRGSEGQIIEIFLKATQLMSSFQMAPPRKQDPGRDC